MKSPKIKELLGGSCCEISFQNINSFWGKIDGMFQLGQPSVQGGQTPVQPAWTQVCPQWTGVSPTSTLKADVNNYSLTHTLY